MLPAKNDTLRIALNRVTFGARDVDVQNVRNTGWPAWINAQLAAPAGDDPALSQYLRAQVLHIEYAAPAASQTKATWKAVNQDRTLNYLTTTTSVLWTIALNTGSIYSPSELYRIRQELAAATWIRNTHSTFQLREFMTDFWHNHFNVGKNEIEKATAMLPVYDRDVIRPNVFGNFRKLLKAVASSSSMLVYLDNYASTATTPNENYAREIMELQTLGSAAYLGTVNPATVPKGADGIAVGFTDQDVLHASRVLSGWTIQYGQKGANGAALPSNGEFIFNSVQHNRTAGMVLGFNMATLNSADMSQGEKFLDILANHPATASFIVTKLAKRMFGDTPPQAVIDRGVAAWKANLAATDQISKVLRAMLLDGAEVMNTPVTKVRRPYERLIALFRTVDIALPPALYMTTLLDPVTDGLFAWQAPNGRPDTNGFWLATGATVASWNYLFQVFYYKEIAATLLRNQTPLSAMNSATAVVEYWLGRMVGFALPAAAMNSMISDQATGLGIPASYRSGDAARLENAHRRLISLITTSEAFTLR